MATQKPVINGTDETGEREQLIEGLQQPQKAISPKYFYDERGSQLFDEITQLPEYYPTETELGIMRDNIDEIVALVGQQASLIEFGSGSSLKTRVLLQNLDSLAAYVPVDISQEHLLASAAEVRAEFPAIEVLPVVADFTQPFSLPTPAVMPVRNIVYFPGSTIGNFARDDALALLQVMFAEAGEDGALLIGVDLQKDVEIIERAYNDDAGVTAQFNKNILAHLNREFDADFEVERFAHSAQYNDEQGRMELRLVSDRDQKVSIGEDTIEIVKGEDILTEYSHKYTLQGFAELAGEAGFTVTRVWTDSKRLFSVQYCRGR